MLAHPPWTLAFLPGPFRVPCGSFAAQSSGYDRSGMPNIPKVHRSDVKCLVFKHRNMGFNRFDHLRCGYSGYRTNDDHPLGVFSSTVNHRIGMMVPEDDDFSGLKPPTSHYHMPGMIRDEDLAREVCHDPLARKHADCDIT